MSRKKIRRQKNTPKTNIIKVEKENKAKQALKSTGNFFKSVGISIGNGVKSTVSKTKNSVQGFTEAHKALREIKRIDEEANVLANLMTVKLDKLEAIEALQDLQQKVQDNLSSINAAILILQEEAENDRSNS